MPDDLVLGDNCDVILYHPDLGEFGYMLYDEEYRVDLSIVRELNESVFLQRIDNDDGTYTNQIVTSILVGEEIQGPMGNIIQKTAYDARKEIADIIDKGTKITLMTPDGAYPSLFTTEEMMSETVFEHFAIIVLRLNQTTASIKPIDTVRLQNSRWATRAAPESFVRQWKSRSDTTTPEKQGYWR